MFGNILNRLCVAGEAQKKLPLAWLFLGEGLPKKSSARMPVWLEGGVAIRERVRGHISQISSCMVGLCDQKKGKNEPPHTCVADQALRRLAAVLKLHWASMDALILVAERTTCSVPKVGNSPGKLRLLSPVARARARKLAYLHDISGLTSHLAAFRLVEWSCNAPHAGLLAVYPDR